MSAAGSFKKLGDARSHAFKQTQVFEPVNPAHGVKGAVECGNSQGADTGRTRALGIHHFGVQSFVAQARQAPLNVEIAALGLSMLLSLYSRLHRQGNSRTGSQRYAGSNHCRRRAVDGGKRCAGATNELHEVDNKVDVLVIALAGQIKPVAVVGVEDQIITHGVAFMWPLTPQCLKNKTSEAVKARVVADRAEPEFSGRANRNLSLWASRKSDIECVETFNVAQPWMPAINLANQRKGGAA